MTDEANKSLSIGQVIYVLSNKTQKILPAVVVEEVIVKKLDGNHVSWKVSVGPAGKEKVIDSNRLNGDIYISLDDIREVLHKRLAAFLDDLIGEADKRVEAWYGKQTIKSLGSLTNSEDPNEKIDPEGLMASIESSSVPMDATRNMFVQKSPSQAQMELRQRMESIADPNIQFPKRVHALEEQADGNTIGSEEILLPGGQRIKVNIKGS